MKHSDKVIDRLMDGFMDGWIYKWMNGWVGGKTDGRTDGRMDGHVSRGLLLRTSINIQVVVRQQNHYAESSINHIINRTSSDTQRFLISGVVIGGGGYMKYYDIAQKQL